MSREKRVRETFLAPDGVVRAGQAGAFSFHQRRPDAHSLSWTEFIQNRRRIGKMRCLVDRENGKNLFWTEKCGCTFVKSLYNLCVRGLAVGSTGRPLHTREWCRVRPDSALETIVVVRNPFHRLVSGFLDKYISGEFTRKYRPESFEDFLGALESAFNHNRFIKIDYDHFCPQFSRGYSSGMPVHHVYDIEAFPVEDFLSHFKCRQTIDPSSRPELVGPHTNKNRSKECIIDAHKLTYDDLSAMKRDNRVPCYDSFYSAADIRERILQLYAADFESLKALGLDYN